MPAALDYFSSNSKEPADPRRKYPTKPNKPFRLVMAEGDYGIEVEIEPAAGTNLPQRLDNTNSPIWEMHNDGSLRNGGLEFVLRQPLPYDAIQEAVNNLYKQLGINLCASIRTSTHVHMNIRGMRFNTLVSVLVLYYALEDVITTWCGPHRVGNLFALRASDVPQIINNWRDFFEDKYRFNEDQDRYMALNPCAINKFGSIEFRAMGGCKDPAEIIKWVALINHIKTLATGKFSNPQEIINTFSGSVPAQFFEEHFSHLAIFPEIMEACAKNEVDLSRCMWEGIRRVQPLVYKYDWDFFAEKAKEVDIPSPFAKKDNMYNNVIPPINNGIQPDAVRVLGMMNARVRDRAQVNQRPLLRGGRPEAPAGIVMDEFARIVEEEEHEEDFEDEELDEDEE